MYKSLENQFDFEDYIIDGFFMNEFSYVFNPLKHDMRQLSLVPISSFRLVFLV